MEIIQKKNIGSNSLIFCFQEFSEENQYEQLWLQYYSNNPFCVNSFYKETKNAADVEKIATSANDTASGFKHLINIVRNGNKEAPYGFKEPIDGIHYGIAYIVPGNVDIKTLNTLENLKQNVLMSVGWFTSEKAHFYVMVGISIGFCYEGESIKGLSGILSSYIAHIMKTQTSLGVQKLAFITRPLEKMSKLFNNNNTSDLNIPYNPNYELPPQGDEKYEQLKELAIQYGKIQQEKAIDWLIENCVLEKICNSNDDCQINQCLGDKTFFIQFVGDVFSPKWPYTGKNINRLATEYENMVGGFNKNAKAINIKQIVNASADDAKNAMIKLINATKFISYNFLVFCIQQNFMKVLSLYKKNRIFLYIDVKKKNLKSESYYWIYNILNQIHKLEIVERLEDKRINDDSIIILLDDCMNHEEHLAKRIENITYSGKNKLTFLLFIPLISNIFISKVYHKFKQNTHINMFHCNLVFSKIITPLSQTEIRDEYGNTISFTKEDAKHLSKYYIDLNSDAIMNGFAVHFDDKIDNTNSIFSHIYYGLIPNNNNLKLQKHIANAQIFYSIIGRNVKKDTKMKILPHELKILEGQLYEIKTKNQYDLIPISYQVHKSKFKEGYITYILDIKSCLKLPKHIHTS